MRIESLPLSQSVNKANMLKIEPTIVTRNSVKFKSGNKPLQQVEKKEKETNKAMIATSLIGLAAIAAGTTYLTKNFIKTYNNALKKAGVQIKDNLAIITNTGEKFTGKIQRFENYNRKETIKFVDGVVTEKLYHNIFGKEIEGEFYKDGKRVLRIWKSIGQAKGSHGFRYQCDGNQIIKDGNFVETKQGFEWARNFIKNMK